MRIFLLALLQSNTIYLSLRILSDWRYRTMRCKRSFLGILVLLLLVALPDFANSQSAKAIKKQLNKAVFKMCISEDKGMIFRKVCKATRGEESVSLLTLPEWGSVRLNGIPSGHVVSGVIGFDDHASASFEDFAGFASFPVAELPGGAGLVSTDILIDETPAVLSSCGKASNCIDSDSLDTSNVCTGEVDNPTAPAGKVCIYPVGMSSNATFLGNTVPFSGSRSGFEVRGVANGSGDIYFQGIWAYQAP